MTDLQLGLLVLGAAAVAGVLIYNRVQERATRRDAERAFGSTHVDVLLGDEAPGPEPTSAPPREREIDYVVELHGVSGARLRAQWIALERRFAKRATLVEKGGRVEARLQLLSRKGVLAEAEVLEFRSKLEALAARERGSVSAPELRPALEAAQALDRECAEVDVQVALHVLGAPQQQMNGEPFQIARRPDGVTLLLDVPRTPDVVRTYDAMARRARELAAAHGGRVVDDNGNALDERALTAIGVEIEAMRARLAALGVEPGSPLALRLFS